ncbi:MULTISPECIES: MFS transporter [unclassified Actinotalea]|uniref:MFS transporter n=1 Tax=unclassified Actinotalea TaxID=2638618 RepID=UPI0015F55B5F|nr:MULTISPECIES: MFS transporter [unclassified Actinotalea]
MSARAAAASQSLWRSAVVRAVFLTNLAGFVSFSATLGALPLRAAQLGHPEAVVGTVTGVMLAVTVATQLVAGALMRRWSVRTLLVAGAVLLGAPSPAYLLVDDLGSWYVLSAVRGVGFALLTVVGAVAIPRAAPRERQGEAIGIYGLSAAIPNMVVVSATTALTLDGRFPVVAWFAAAPLLALVVRGLPRDRVGAEPGRRDGRGALGPTVRRLLLPTATLFLVTMCGGGLVTVLPLQRPDGPVAAVALLVYGATGALARWRVGHLTDRRGHRVVTPVLLVLGTAGLAAVALGLRDADVGGTASLVVGAGLFGVAFGALQSVTLDVSLARVPDAHAPTASSVWNAAFDGGTAAGAALLGFLAGAAVGGPAAVGAGALGLGVLAVVSVMSRDRTTARATFVSAP